MTNELKQRLEFWGFQLKEGPSADYFNLSTNNLRDICINATANQTVYIYGPEYIGSYYTPDPYRCITTPQQLDELVWFFARDLYNEKLGYAKLLSPHTLESMLNEEYQRGHEDGYDCAHT